MHINQVRGCHGRTPRPASHGAFIFMKKFQGVTEISGNAGGIKALSVCRLGKSEGQGSTGQRRCGGPKNVGDAMCHN